MNRIVRRCSGHDRPETRRIHKLSFDMKSISCGIVAAIPALVMVIWFVLAYEPGNYQTEIPFVAGVIFLITSLVLGLRLPGRLQMLSQVTPQVVRNLLFRYAMIAWALAAFSIVVTSQTSMFLGKENGDGLNSPSCGVLFSFFCVMGLSAVCLPLSLMSSRILAWPFCWSHVRSATSPSNAPLDRH